MTKNRWQFTNHVAQSAGIARLIRCLATLLMFAGGVHASPIEVTPNSQDLIVGRSDAGAPLANGYHADPSQGIGAGVTGGTGERYNRNAVIGFLLPTLSAGQTIDTASFRVTISSNNSAGGGKPVALYGLSTANLNSSGTMLFATDTVAGKLANAGNALISATFSSTGSTSGTPQADVSDFIRSFYTGNVPHQAEVFFRICPTVDTWPTTNRLDFTKGSARLEITTTAGDPVLYRQTGSDPTFQELIDNGVIVPGVSAGTGPVPGSAIRVNQTMLAQQAGNLGTIPSDIRIHTQVNSSVLRSNFPNFTRWYQEVGNVQVMRLFEGEQNIRSGIGPDGTPGRIEAYFTPFAVASGTWAVWEATYTIIDPLQSNIFQLFHEGGQLWAFHLRMTNTGTIYFARRNEIDGLPTNITIATNMVGQSISFRVRANGSNYELYKKIPFVDPDWVLLTTGTYAQAVNNEISFRWGMYYGSQQGESIPNDGLLFVSGVKRSTEPTSINDPPPTPPPPVNYYWDNNGATAGFGAASGNWGIPTTGNNTQGWSTSSGGTVLPANVSTNTTDPVFFGTDSSGLSSGTITVSDTVSAADITFGAASGNITLNGGEIQMFGSRKVSIGGSGKTHTIRSVLAGDSTRTIGGSGTLVLTGANEFDGPLVIGDNTNDIRLRINSIANADGTPSAVGAPITSTIGIIQIGAVSRTSTLELSGSTAPQTTNRRIRIGSDSNGSGGATIQNNNSSAANTLTFSNSAFNVAATGITTTNRTLTLGGSNTGDNLIQGAIIDNVGTSGGKVALAKSGSGTWVLAGANAYTGNTSISEGTLRIGNGGETGSLSTSGSITNNGTLEFRRSNTLTQGTDFTPGAISGTGALVQSGTGTTILNAANTYQGLTTINAGTLRILNGGALGSTTTGTVVNGAPSSGSVNARLELAGDIIVSGEAVTLSGGGNFLGALTSQSGSNEWSGNVTIAAPATRIGASEGATLRVNGVIDSGGDAHGLTIRIGGTGLDGTVVLAGSNTYLGETQLMIGRLRLDGGNNRLPVATRLIMGNAGDRSEFDLNGRSQEIAGLGLRGGVTVPSNHVVTNSSASPSTLTINTPAGSPSSFDGILNGNLALTKTGDDTLTLTGLSADAAENHSGTTTIGGGTLLINTTNPSLAGGLTFGSSTGAAENGSLDLSSASATFGGTLLARTNSATANTIGIGPGRTLQLNGAVTVGYNTTSLPHSTSRLDVAGAGTLAIGTSGSPTHDDVQIGNGSTSNVGNAGTLDLSGLANFSAHLGTGIFRVGSTTNSGGQNGGGSTAILAHNNLVHASAVTLAAPETSAVQTLRLGSGTNEIHTDTLNVGGPAPGDGRSSGQLLFNSPTGTLRIRSQSDPANGRANLNVGNITQNTGVNSLAHLFDTTGHFADLRFSTMTVGTRASTGTLASGNVAAEFKFDTGTLDADNLVVGSRSGAASGLAASGAGIVSIAGGSVIVHNTGGPVQLGSNTFINGSAAGTLHISGGSVSIAAHGGNSILLGNATSAGGAATGTLDLTGGTLAVTGRILRGATTGTSNAALTLDGATLDMGGNPITGLTSITYSSGTLKNLGIVNTGMTLSGSGLRVFDQGAGVTGEIQGTITGIGIGLAKQGSGTLILSGPNTYSGPTAVNQGTLALVGAGIASPVTVASGASLAFTPGAPATSTSSLNLANGTVKIFGPVDSATSYTLITASGGITGLPVLDAAIPGYELQVRDGGTSLVLVHFPDYDSWAATHAGGQGPELDFDRDGVPNGIEFFLNAAPGFTTLPVPDATRTVTWSNGGNIPASHYGTRFVVQTSTNLVHWNDVPIEDITINTDGPGGVLSYTPTGAAPCFVRLKVTPL